MIRPTLRYFRPPRSNAALPRSVRQLLERSGGIVSTRELASVGIAPTTLEVLRSYGVLQPVRQGWHCASDLPEINRVAWRLGGPLACVSALRFHHVQAVRRVGIEIELEIGEPLHIALPSNSVGPPSSELLAQRWGIPAPQRPVVHWGTAEALSGDRKVVSLDVARAQAARCDAAAGLAGAPLD
jgi:hypothetical protein